MPLRIDAPHGCKSLHTEPLSQKAFSAFGTVIENPAPSLIPQELAQLPPNAVQANQGSAIKYLDVTYMRDLYTAAPSLQPAKAVMNMFVCAPRQLVPSQNTSIEGVFPVKILERHPYTTQTFIPLGTSPNEAHRVRYLVIVAPSLPTSPADDHLPVPPSTATSRRLPGRGLPDLKRVKAFMANGSQAVTYGAGTWHAPMVVIGNKPIDFVVVQFANGVAIEDCQEVDWENGEEGEVLIAVPAVESKQGLSKL
jgi:ureidoglycolate lyase